MTALRTRVFTNAVGWCTLTIVVLVTYTLLTTRGPPQPCQHGTPTNPGGPHHGTSGSPQPSATQLTSGTPTPTRKPDPPKNATSPGAYTGLTRSGPGAHPQPLLRDTQRP